MSGSLCAMPLWQSMQVLSPKQEALVRRGRAGILPRQVHRLITAAVAALERVVRLHAFPFPLGQMPAHRQELLARVDGAEDVTPDLF